jgi:hypothetical protein
MGDRPHRIDHGAPPQVRSGAVGVRRPWPWASALIAIATYGVLQRRGIGLTLDGWAYWQSAVSLTEGKGLRYFSGNPIVAWPPLYSLYLAAWSLLLGPTAIALIAGNGVLIGAQAYLWSRLGAALSDDRSRWPIHACVAVWLGLLIPETQTWVFAHNLNFVLLPVFLLCVWRLTRQARFDRRAFAMAALVAAMLTLNHNSSVVFLAGAGLVLLWLPAWPIRSRLLASCGLVAAGLLASLGMRLALGQSGSHPFVGGRFSVLETTTQAVQGLNSFVARGSLWPLTTLLGIAALAFVLRHDARRRARFVVVFCVAPLVLLIALFSTIWLNGTIAEQRHLLFVPLLAGPYVVLNGRRLGPVALAIVVAALLAVQTRRTVRHDHQLADRADLIPPSTRLGRVDSQGVVRKIGDQWVVGPIDWEEPIGGYDRDGTPRWGPSQSTLKDRHGGVLIR